MTRSYAPPTSLPPSLLMSGPATVVLVADGGVVHLPGREVLASGMFSHAGHDLVIKSPEGVAYLIKGFFTVDHPPALVDASGTVINGADAAAYAGPANVGVYAAAGGAGPGTQIGQIRTTTGDGTITRADGTVVPLKVGTPLYTNDTIDTGAATKAGIVLIDGTTLAMDAKAELVLDELIYDPASHGGTEKISLVSGAASFVSGQIAHSGQDHMKFHTPVATIGIRGTTVYAAFDPGSGKITVLNLPVLEADGTTGVGKIALFLPDGSFAGEITTSNSGWQFNPSKGEGPSEVQFTPAQVQSIAGAVESVLSATFQQSQQQQNNGQQNNGGQGKQGSEGNSGNQNGGNGNGNQNTTPPPPAHSNFNANGTQGSNSSSNNTASTDTTPGGGNGTGTGTNTSNTSNTTSNTPTTTTTTTPQPPILPTQVTVSGDGGTDHRPGSATFTITRVNNLNQTTTVSYTTVDGTAKAGTDYTAVSGSVTFAPMETSKLITVPVLVGVRTVTGAETFSLAISGGGGITASGAATDTLAPPPPLPTVTIGNAAVSDNAAGTAQLTVTRTGDLSLPSTVHYQTADGSAAGGTEYTPSSGTVSFAAGQASATITVAILPESKILSVHTQHGVETFTVSLSSPDGATLGAQTTGTVTVNATPVVGQATFSVGGASVNEGGTAAVTVTRGGDLVGQVTVAYGTANGTAHAGADYTAESGTLTFAPGQTTATIAIPTASEAAPEPARSFTVGLSNPDGGSITTATGTVAIAAVASPLPTISISSAGPVDDTTSSPHANFTVSLSSASTSTVSFTYATANGSAVAGTNFVAIPNTSLSFSPGQTSLTIPVTILNPGASHSAETFLVNLTSATGATLGSSQATGTIDADTVVIPHSAPLLVGAGLVEAIQAGTTNPPGKIVGDIFSPVVVPDQGSSLAGVVVTGNFANPTSEGDWQYSTDGGGHWHDVGTAMNDDSTQGLLLSSSTFVRFVPTAGFTAGVANDLTVRAIDSTYTGPFSSGAATETPVTIGSTSLSGDTAAVSSGGNVAIAAVGTLTHWVGGAVDAETDWTVAANWDSGLPGPLSAAVIDGATVTLGSSTEQIGGLQMLDVASLTVTSSDLDVNAGGSISLHSTILLDEGDLSTEGAFAIYGTLTLGTTIDSSSLQTHSGGSFEIFGTLNAVDGVIEAPVIIEGGGQMNVQNTSDLVEDYDPLYIQQGGALNIIDNGTSTVLAAFGGVTNAGTIEVMVTAGAGETGASLNAAEGETITNLNGGVIRFDAAEPSDSGGLTLAGYVTNEAGGTILVNHDTTYDEGILTNSGGTIAIASGAIFNIADELDHKPGAILSGSGTLLINNDADLLLYADAVIPRDLTLQLGTTTGEGAFVDGGEGACGVGSLIIAGTGNFYSASIDSNVEVTSGGLIQVMNSGDRVYFEELLTVDAGGKLTISDNTPGSSGSSLAIEGDLYLNNSGTILLTSGSSENGGSSLEALEGASIHNLSGGLIITDNSNGGGGPREIFGTVNNYSGGVIQIDYSATYSGDNTLTNSGTISIASGQTLTVSFDSVVDQRIASASITGLGNLFIDSGGALDVGLGTVAPRIEVSGLLQMGDDGALATDTGGVAVDASGTFQVIGIASDTVAHLTDGLGNSGHVEITSSGGAHNVTLDMGDSAFSFANNSGGTFEIDSGGGGGGRTFIGAITNSGYIDVETNATFDANFSGIALDNQVGGQFFVQEGATADFEYADGQFVNESGASLIIDGTLNIGGNTVLVENGGDFSSGGTIDIAAGAQFNLETDATIPDPMTLNVGSHGGVNALVNGVGRTLNVFGFANFYDANVNPSVTAGEGGQVQVIDGTTTFNAASNLVDAGGTLNVVDATADGSATVLDVPGLLTVYGTVVLQASTSALNGSDNAVLDMTTGALVIQTGGLVELVGDHTGTSGLGTDFLEGTVTIDSGAALEVFQGFFGSVYTNGTLTNGGFIEVDPVAVLSIANGATVIEQNGSSIGGGGEIVNFGTIQTSGGTSTLTLSNLSTGFDNRNLGVVNVTVGSTLNIMGSGYEFLNEAGAVLTVNGILNMNGNNLTNDGNITGTGMINMEGGTFTEAGTSTITPDPPDAPGRLTIDGSAVFGAGTTTHIALGGTADGLFDVLSVTDHFTLGGILDVQSYEGFAPHAGDSFNVVTWGSSSGMFDAATGLVFGGVALDPILSDTGLTLVARTVTQQAGDGDQTLTGSTSHDNVLVGGSGNDTLIAGPGHDLLIGGKGDTTFIPGAGNDHMVGGAGTNTVDFSSQPGPVNVNLSQGTATTSTGAQDTLIGIQNINGTPYADTIVGNAHDNIIDGGGGADTLTGGGGHTTFEFDSPSQGGATITNFASGRDIIALLSSAFGLGSSITAGQNFSTIETAFNGTYAGVNAAFTASQPTLVFSTHDDALYYDPHGTGPGYSLVAHLEPGAAVAANDIHLMHGVLA